MKHNTKLLGGIGSVLLALGFVPYIGSISFIVGIGLLLTAVKNYSKEVGRPELSLTFAKGISIWFTGSFLGIVVTMIGAWIFSLGIIQSVLLVGIGILTIYVTSIVGCNLLRKAFTEIALLTGNGWFERAGKLFFWGALLLIVLIGGVWIYAGLGTLIVAFFTTPESE
ncbi:MAG: DUF996 domain-containing protein [Nitrospiraceae bacterium]|nr:DUF996 domain-containing protein [Nitrospiraceae bacterium]